jgi:hypothetical protein
MTSIHPISVHVPKILASCSTCRVSTSVGSQATTKATEASAESNTAGINCPIASQISDVTIIIAI